MKKIIVISGSTGGGHVSAANSIQLYAEKMFSQKVQVIHIDVIKYMSPFFKKVYADTYIKMIKYFPSIFGFLYKITDHEKNKKVILSEMRYHFEEFFSKKFKKVIKKYNPDYIIFTHFLPAEHLNKTVLKNKYANKYAVVVTDFDVHSLWVQENMDLFFVANEESALRLASKGIDKNKIYVTGIPIAPEFAEQYDKEKIKAELSLSPKLDTVLLMTGAYGIGRVDFFTEHLFESIDKEFQLIALTGKNEKLAESLEKIEAKYPGKIKTVGFTNEVYKYMAACAFAVTKTGGLTTSECLAMGLPIITLNPIPGQEGKNTSYLLENGAALKTDDVLGLTYRVQKLLNDKELLARMQENARRIANPNAAENILNIVLKG